MVKLLKAVVIVVLAVAALQFGLTPVSADAPPNTPPTGAPGGSVGGPAVPPVPVPPGGI